MLAYIYRSDLCWTSRFYSPCKPRILPLIIMYWRRTFSILDTIQVGMSHLSDHTFVLDSARSKGLSSTSYTPALSATGVIFQVSPAQRAAAVVIWGNLDLNTSSINNNLLDVRFLAVSRDIDDSRCQLRFFRPGGSPLSFGELKPPARSRVSLTIAIQCLSVPCIQRYVILAYHTPMIKQELSFWVWRFWKSNILVFPYWPLGWHQASKFQELVISIDDFVKASCVYWYLFWDFHI